MKHSFIRTLLSIVAMHDYELEQLDVKTAFLHGELEEDIYMEQPEGFIIPVKEHPLDNGTRDLTPLCSLKVSKGLILIAVFI